MIIYSNLEKQAIIKIAYDMMMVDGDRDFNEVSYLARIKTLLGLGQYSSDNPMSQEAALSIIYDMDDDKKMEVGGILQGMMMADGFTDKREMFFFGQVVSKTGIDKVVERKTRGLNIQHDDANIYCNSSKIALSKRSHEYLQMIKEQAETYKRYFEYNPLSFDQKCQMIVELSKECVKDSGWDLNDVDGVSWFIGNITDAMIIAEAVPSYDDTFKKCFKMYFDSL